MQLNTNIPLSVQHAQPVTAMQQGAQFAQQNRLGQLQIQDAENKLAQANKPAPLNKDQASQLANMAAMALEDYDNAPPEQRDQLWANIVPHLKGATQTFGMNIPDDKFAPETVRMFVQKASGKWSAPKTAINPQTGKPEFVSFGAEDPTKVAWTGVSAPEKSGQTINVNTGGGKAAEEFGKGEGQAMVEVVTLGRNARKQNTQLKMLERYSKNAPSGMFAEGKITAGKAAQFVGVDPSVFGLSKDEIISGEKFRSVTKDLVLQKQIAQKGPQTDSDRAVMEDTLAKLGNTPEANQAIIDFSIAQNDRDIAYADFVRKFARENNGNPTGAEDAWFAGEGAKSIFDNPRLKKYLSKEDGGTAQPKVRRFNPATGRIEG